ncbi:hypothetical protein DVH24_009095 [Malus domestica]|uniref:Geranylgeranyl transferase type-2 subunit beta n=1 Tax=Malus domestica TaxID=3750 RepID=A0A498JTT7_MALDO|nr:hypothetical protein DVH24_009095 [Malus domestica]
MGELAAEKHVQFILSVEKKKDSLEAVAMEHLRMNGAYWGLTTLDLLGKIQVLALFNKIDVLDVDKVASYKQIKSKRNKKILLNLIFNSDVAALQNKDGSFSGDMWGEIDTRFSYIAILCLALLHRLNKINVEKAVNYITHLNFDLPMPTAVFCCVGALAITGSLHHIDKDLLGWWLCERQVNSGDILIKSKAKPGGLNGRPEKLPDVCYSWWVLSSLVMIDRVHWIDKEKLVKFILDCQDIENGGISDRPDDAVDVYHTYFGVAGLSLLEYPGMKALDPAYALPVDVVNRIILGK